MARDENTWRLGHAADVARINAATTVGTTITSPHVQRVEIGHDSTPSAHTAT